MNHPLLVQLFGNFTNSKIQYLKSAINSLTIEGIENNSLIFQIFVIATFVAYGQAGIIGAPAAYSTQAISLGPALGAPAYTTHAYAAPAYAAPAFTTHTIAAPAIAAPTIIKAAPVAVKAAPSVDYVVSLIS